jgi:hypothetical protein
MRIKTGKGLALITALVAGLVSPFGARAQTGGFDNDSREAQKHGWLFSYQDGLDQARKLRKPMMLVFRCVP